MKSPFTTSLCYESPLYKACTKKKNLTRTGAVHKTLNSLKPRLDGR
jgi:hypothetical protein